MLHVTMFLHRSFKISCRGRGVLPALKLSENVVNFAATPLNSLTTAHISLANPRLSRLSSPVIRGAVLPQGPKLFEFSVPDGVPLEISPRVGTLDLDEVHINDSSKILQKLNFLCFLASIFTPPKLD